MCKRFQKEKLVFQREVTSCAFEGRRALIRHFVLNSKRCRNKTKKMIKKYLGNILKEKWWFVSKGERGHKWGLRQDMKIP